MNRAAEGEGGSAPHPHRAEIQRGFRESAERTRGLDRLRCFRELMPHFNQNCFRIKVQVGGQRQLLPQNHIRFQAGFGVSEAHIRQHARKGIGIDDLIRSVEQARRIVNLGDPHAPVLRHVRKGQAEHTRAQSLLVRHRDRDRAHGVKIAREVNLVPSLGRRRAIGHDFNFIARFLPCAVLQIMQSRGQLGETRHAVGDPPVGQRDLVGALPDAMMRATFDNGRLRRDGRRGLAWSGSLHFRTLRRTGH